MEPIALNSPANQPPQPTIGESTRSLPNLFPLPAVVIASAAFVVIVPFFFLGNASGHDFEFHLFSWMEVVHQWKEGILFPRWATFAHWTYGEARFLFYPPISWNLGAFLGTFLPWETTAGVYIWLVLTGCGISMFVLARRWFGRGDAIFAAVFYALNPYHLVVVYWRSAFAELLVGALIPLLLLYALRADDDGPRVILPLGLIVAGAWLTNVPAAVMVNYSLALLLVTVAILRRSYRVLLYGAGAVALGSALAAFYLVPAAYEQSWISLNQVLAPGVHPFDNFLFTNINDADHNRFNLFVSLVAVPEILLAAASLSSLRKKDPHWAPWSILAVWAVVASFVMLKPSFFLWAYLPELRFVQLPWRWLLCLNVPIVIAVTATVRRWAARFVLYVGVLALLLVLWNRVQPSWWDKTPDIDEMHDAIQDGSGYEGTDEYVPAGVDPYDLNQNAPLVAVVGRDKANIRILDWTSQSKRFTAEVTRPETLRLRLLNYPAWRVDVNGVAIAAKSQPHTSEILIPVDTGISEIRIKFIQTPDRFWGGIISLITALGIFVWLIYRRRAQLAGSLAKQIPTRILDRSSLNQKLIFSASSANSSARSAF